MNASRAHTLAVLSAIRRPRRKRKVGRIPRPLPPTRIAEAYAKAIRDRVCALARACFDEHAGEILHLLAERRRSMGRADAAPDQPRDKSGKWAKEAESSAKEAGRLTEEAHAASSSATNVEGHAKARQRHSAAAIAHGLTSEYFAEAGNEAGEKHHAAMERQHTAEAARHAEAAKVQPAANGWESHVSEGPPGWKAGAEDVTRRDIGSVDPKLLAHIPGRLGEEKKFEHGGTGRKSAEEWRQFIDYVRANGVPGKIQIHKDIDGKVVIHEGNHRLRAAIAAGLKSVPVEITYFGNSQRSGLVVDPSQHTDGIGKAIGRAAQLGAKAAESDEQQARSIAAALSAAERAGRKQYEHERRSTSAALTGATIEGRYAGRLLDRAAREFAEKFHPTALHAVVKQFGRRTDEHSRQQLDQQLRSAIGVPLSTIEKPARDKIDGWAAANVDRIVTVPETYFDRLRLDVEEAFEDGTRPEDLADSFVERYGMSERQAELVARDQVLKLAADLNHDRMQSLGVERAIWRTMNDERVSEDCAEHEGEEFDLAAGIDGAFPGSEHPMCRCYSEPILDDLIPDVDES